MADPDWQPPPELRVFLVADLEWSLLARILEEGHVKKCGMVNSVNEEGAKCETIFPIIAGTPWEVVGLTCDQDGIPADPKKKGKAPSGSSTMPSSMVWP